MTIYYLYQKTHIKTGIKYLGYTTRNPFTYNGSGIAWNKHLREHGFEIETLILLESLSKDEIKKQGRYYSELWDIVNSFDWANQMKETGGGPGGIKGVSRSEFTKEKIRNQLKGRKHSAERNKEKSIRQTGKKQPWVSANLKGRTNTKISDALIDKPKLIAICPHCNKSGGAPAMGRWHFDNCNKKSIMS